MSRTPLQFHAGCMGVNLAWHVCQRKAVTSSCTSGLPSGVAGCMQLVWFSRNCEKGVALPSLAAPMTANH